MSENLPQAAPYEYPAEELDFAVARATQREAHEAVARRNRQLKQAHQQELLEGWVGETPDPATATHEEINRRGRALSDLEGYLAQRPAEPGRTRPKKEAKPKSEKRAHKGVKKAEADVRPQDLVPEATIPEAKPIADVPTRPRTPSLANVTPLARLEAPVEQPKPLRKDPYSLFDRWLAERGRKKREHRIEHYYGWSHPKPHVSVKPTVASSPKAPRLEVDETPEAIKWEVEALSEPAAYRQNPESKKYRTPNEDEFIANSDSGLFAVFDGVGGSKVPGSAKASARAAANAFSAYFELPFVEEALNREDLTEDDALMIMSNIFALARTHVIEEGKGGDTTAAVVKMVSVNNKPYALIGVAGDSRILKYPATDTDKAPGYWSLHTKPDQLYELAEDQSQGNALLNSLGWPKGIEKHKSDVYRLVPLEAGDRLVVCSDGITGDDEYDFLTSQELKIAFLRPRAIDAVQAFMSYSKKNDDKTIIVIDIQPAA